MINHFLTVSRRGSFSSAAAHLGIDPSTVSKSIQQLEKHLNLRLFNRTTRRLQLTDAGEVYRESCANLLDGLAVCEQQLSTEQSLPSGMLRVNLPVAYGQLYIMPMIGEFCRRYPEIQLEISLTDDYVDMVSQSVDVAIRSGQLKDSRLVARKLSPMDFATCASPVFLSNTKKIISSNIQKQPWIRYRFLHTGRIMPVYSINRKNQRCDEFTPKTSLVTTDGLSMVTACKAGIGLIQAPHFLVRDGLQSGELALVQSFYRSDDFSVYAYYSQKDYMPLKVRVFLDFIVSELQSMDEDHDSTFLSKQ